MGVLSWRGVRHSSFRTPTKKKVLRNRVRSFLIENLEHRHLMASVPVAVDDPIYSTPLNTDLVISTSTNGILHNDSDIDGSALTGTVIVSPTHGTLISFGSNGTFTYRPTSGYSGPDSFTYKASNGTLDSNVATASIQVGQVFGPRTNVDEIPRSAPNFTGSNLLSQPLTLGQQLVYNSDTEPRPVVVVETSLRSSATVPTSIEAQLTFGGVAGSTVTYSTSGLSAGAPLRFALQVDGSSLSTGYYDYTFTLTAKYSGGTDVVQTFTGSQAIVNRSASEFGRGWWIDGLDRLVVSSAGGLLVMASGDSLWFKKNGSNWDKATGDLSVSTLTQSGSNYVLTAKTGEVQSFNSSGYLTSVVDRNGNSISFAYNGSNQLTTITDPFSRTFSIAYTSGLATSITDYAGHTATLAYTSGKLTSVTLPDPDGAGAKSAPVFSYAYSGTTNLLTGFTDPGSHTTSYSYDSASRRLSQITHPDSSTLTLVPVQTIGLKTGTGNSLTAPSAAQGKITDETGHDWKFRTDRFGQTTEFVNPVGSTTVILRNANGLPYKITEADPDGGMGSLTSPITLYGYNSSGDVLKQINPDLSTQLFTYNSLHLPLTASDEVGRVTTFTYDTYGNATTRQDNAGNTWTYTYTSRGLVASETSPDPDGAGSLTAYVTGYTYDSNGRLTTKTLPNSSTLTYTYNTSNLVTSETNELGYTTTYAYDELDRLVTLTKADPDGSGSLSSPVISFAYNAAGLLASQTDPLGNLTSLTYDSRNRRTVLTHPDPDGAGSLAAPTETWTYDGTGRVLTYVDSLIAGSDYEYSADGLLTQITTPSASIETREYDALGRLVHTELGTKEEDFEYNSRGQMTKHSVHYLAIGASANYDTLYSYNYAGQPTSTTDGNGHTTSWDYTLAGWLNSETKPDLDGSGPNFGPQTTYGYDALGNLISISDPNGNISNVEYNFRGQATKLIQPDPDGSGSLTSPITTQAYNNAGWSTSVTDPLSRVTSYSFDNLGRRLTETLPDPDGSGSLSAPVTSYVYNAADWNTSITDARGGVTTMSYDNDGRTTSVTAPDPDGSGSLTSAVTTYTYGSHGLASVTDALGNTTSYGYDTHGNVTTVTDALSHSTTSAFDDKGQLTSVTDPLGHVTSYAYDPFGRLISKTEANAGKTTYGYDAVNNLISLKDPVGNQTNWSYDALNRMTMETNQLGKSRSYVYDPVGNMTRKTDRNGRVTQYDYDQLDRNTASKWMSGTTQTPSIAMETTQDGDSSVNEVQTITLSDATGGTFRLAFQGQTTAPIAYNASAATVDSALEALKTIGSGSVSVSLASGAYTVTFSGGSLQHTDVNSLQGDVSSATYGTVDRTITTTYDAASQITQESDPSATIDYTLDSLGRATSIVNTIAGLTPTVTFDQSFSTGSDRTQLKAKIGSTNDFKTDFTFDTLGRVTDIIQQGNSGNAVASKHVTLAYNKLSQYTAINRYESTGTSNQVASTDFAYDTLNRLTDIDHKQGSTVLASYDYTYDYASRITGVNSSQDGQTNYTYDIVNQVTAADHTGQTDESFEFDANGNRQTMGGMGGMGMGGMGGMGTGGYTVGTNNLMTSDGKNSYLYDDEGNRTKKTETSTGNYTTYTWDYRNRLTAVRDYSSSNVLLKETLNAYDTHNRLIQSSFDADGSGSGAVTTRYWAFDGGINPLLEFKSSSASDVSHRYLWGQAVDQLFADEQLTSPSSAGNILWALTDNLGTIRDIADLSGSTTSITNHRRLGVYGDLVSESNTAVDMLFAFTGKLYDENTKLQNNLNRWYDGSTGQWMSQDPLAFMAGDANLRRYVAGHTTFAIDPSGLRQHQVFMAPGVPAPLSFAVDPDVFALTASMNVGSFVRDSSTVAGPLVWVYTGNWTVQTNVWQAATTAAGQSYIQNAGNAHLALQITSDWDPTNLASSVDMGLTYLEGEAAAVAMANADPTLLRARELSERAAMIVNVVQTVHGIEGLTTKGKTPDCPGTASCFLAGTPVLIPDFGEPVELAYTIALDEVDNGPLYRRMGIATSAAVLAIFLIFDGKLCKPCSDRNHSLRLSRIVMPLRKK